MHVINGDLTVAGKVTADHFGGRADVKPTLSNVAARFVVALDANANDNGMTFTATPGSSPPDGDVFTVNFGRPFAQPPHVVFSPGNDVAAYVAGKSGLYVRAVTAAGFTFTCAPLAPASSPVVPCFADGATCIWHFVVEGN